jgi:hypothetical protein
MQNITLVDFLLLPVYLVFFYSMAKRMARSYADPKLRSYLMTSFWLRMLGCVLYTLVVEFYYGYGDSITYYSGGKFFTEQINKDLTNINYLFAPIKEVADWYNLTTNNMEFSGYFGTASGNMVMRISAVLSYLSFNKFLLISLFFGFFSFAGQWKLFLVFDEINNNRRTKLLAYATLYSPSIWFWGSGLMKDSICLGALGFIIHILYKAMVRKTAGLWDYFFLAILVYFVVIIKSYIILILLVSLAILFFANLLKRVKNVILKSLLIIMMAAASFFIAIGVDLSSQINEMAEESIRQIQSFQQIYQNINESEEGSVAGFEMKDLNPSMGSLILKSPYVVFSCLYRPFLWESRKVMVLFTALESTLLLFCTLYLLFKAGPFRFFRIIFNNPFLVFCLTLSILFALVIGFTTFNFGTMVRYKIIFLPFLYFMMVRIYIEYLSLKTTPTG